MKKKVYSIGDKMYNYGGAQKVMLDIHRGLGSEYECFILGFTDFKELNPNYGIFKNEYLKFSNPFRYRNSTMLVHSRRLITILVLLNRLLNLRLRLIYIAHNVYAEKRAITLLPNTIVSISDRVTHNLINYFNVKPETIVKIHNGIEDLSSMNDFDYNTRKINVLYPARVNDVKQQVEIVKRLKSDLHSNIQISFAGTGPDFDALKSEVGDDTRFRCLGFIKDVTPLLKQCDFVMLFSKKEGLPISLIEGAMFGKPLIVNDVGGNLEIAFPGENAFLATGWEELSKLLKKLPNLPKDEYSRMASNSRRIYEKYFTYEKMIKQYSNIIKNG